MQICCGVKLNGAKFCCECGKKAPTLNCCSNCQLDFSNCAMMPKFCPDCGTPTKPKETKVVLVCSQCGCELQSIQKFCVECGCAVNNSSSSAHKSTSSHKPNNSSSSAKLYMYDDGAKKRPLSRNSFNHGESREEPQGRADCSTSAKLYMYDDAKKRPSSRTNNVRPSSRTNSVPMATSVDSTCFAERELREQMLAIELETAYKEKALADKRHAELSSQLRREREEKQKEREHKQRMEFERQRQKGIMEKRRIADGKSAVHQYARNQHNL